MIQKLKTLNTNYSWDDIMQSHNNYIITFADKKNVNVNVLSCNIWFLESIAQHSKIDCVRAINLAIDLLNELK